jgi:predicted nucleic-acid-binding Zn-ribbon protein
MSKELCPVEAIKLRDKVHHFVSVITGARKKDCCPKCGSEEWYLHVNYSKIIEEFDDGHDIGGGMSYDYSFRTCDECDYSDD